MTPAQDAITKLAETKIEQEYGRATWTDIYAATRTAREAIMAEAAMTPTEADDHLRRQTAALLATRLCQCRLLSATCEHGRLARPDEDCGSHHEADVPPVGPNKIMLCGTCYCDAPEEEVTRG